MAQIGEVDVAYGEIRESDRDGNRKRGRAMPRGPHGTDPSHCDRSAATQARLYTAYFGFRQVSHVSGRRCAA
jgi:hypothetical protein